MKVQSRRHTPPFHAHAHHPDQHLAHPNGVHSDSRPRYPASATDHLPPDDMNPYQQYPYGHGHNTPQQHHRPPPNQLPPMYPNPNMNMAPQMPPPGQIMAGQVPNNPHHQPIYPAAPSAGLPPQPGPAALEAQNAGGPKSLSGDNGKYRFELRVEQQPQRARMCGFGDKDRRPITPPPCVRLVIYDLQTGEEVPHDRIDGSFFVLQVDLWDDNATREVNIVKSSTSSPAVSISTATTTSYPPTETRQHYQEVPPGLYSGPGGVQMYGTPAGYPPPVRPDMFMQQMAQPAYIPNHFHNPGYMGPSNPVIMAGQNHNANLLTRNLIGSLTVNAASLKDTEGKPGFWFVLQDLSVRTEGWFRYYTSNLNNPHHTSN